MKFGVFERIFETGEGLLLLRKLMRRAKEINGVEEEDLLFVGMADIAEYYWCAMKSYFLNRDSEIDFFGAYLSDRIEYSIELGYIKEVPDNPNEWLKVGDEITFEDVECLFKRRKEEFEKESDEEPRWISFVKDGVAYVNPQLPADLREVEEERLKAEGYEVAKVEELDPLLRGSILEESKAEKYPTIRWNFRHEGFIVLGVPDGMTDDLVYEFKTTRSGFLRKFVRPVAFEQANLYGYFFKRPKRRVQIYVLETDSISTWEVDVKKEEAEDLLKNFGDLVETKNAIPPKPWKCKSCRYKSECPIYRVIY